MADTIVRIVFQGRYQDLYSGNSDTQYYGNDVGSYSGYLVVDYGHFDQSYGFITTTVPTVAGTESYTFTDFIFEKNVGGRYAYTATADVEGAVHHRFQANWNTQTPAKSLVFLSAIGNGHTTSADSLADVTSAPCYCPGTLIATARGEVPVEDLRIGDSVLTLHGGYKPVRWIGQRAYDGRFIAGRFLMLPVRIAAGAIEEGVPRRDLRVSPGHALYIDGVLVPAFQLVNGRSVTQATAVESVRYIHVELDDHDVLLAEGCPAESYLDNGDRRQFGDAASPVDGESGPSRSCAPRLEHGFALQAIRDRVAARAAIKPDAGPPGPLRGYLDRAGPDGVEGWAIDEGRPGAPVCLDILVGGRRVARALANMYRADVRDAGIDGGLCGFSASLPEGCSGPIEVRRSSDAAPLAAAAGCRSMTESAA